MDVVIVLFIERPLHARPSCASPRRSACARWLRATGLTTKLDPDDQVPVTQQIAQDQCYILARIPSFRDSVFDMSSHNGYNRAGKLRKLKVSRYYDTFQWGDVWCVVRETASAAVVEL
jgi:hypothetical protein